MRSVRSAVRAIIVVDGKLLTIAMQRPGGETFYILPGGGQQHGETLEKALRRECREELGTEIEIHELLYVREYIGRNHTFANHHRKFHQLEAVFRCGLAAPDSIRVGESCDKHQIGTEWMPLERLATVDFFPKVLATFVEGDAIVVPSLYLGDIN